jgi:hypothetical protein
VKRILVTGSRWWSDRKAVFDALDRAKGDLPPSEVMIIHGDATGADSFADQWARKNCAPRAVFPADWRRFGKSAGPIRNRQMLKETKPDLVLAFPKETSRGTWDMVNIARDAGVIVEVV